MPKWRVGFSGTASKIIEAHTFTVTGDGVYFKNGTGETVALIANMGWRYIELVKDELQGP